MLLKLRNDLKKMADHKKAAFFPHFFKTAKGEYGYGDKFLGVTVPSSRKIALKYKNLQISEIDKLMRSPVHEERLVALFILVNNFIKGDSGKQRDVYDYYLRNSKFVNNWDLVDSSADKIVGGFLLDKSDRSILVRLAKSNSLWDKRIAVIATFQFIKKRKEYKDTFLISEILLDDPNDLIHKAVGWMLREVGKRISQEKEEQFLKTHYKKMPRTMLRYSIEQFEPYKRKRYLTGKV